MESHTYTVYGSIDPHQHSSFLEAEGKKTGVVISGNPCTLSKFHVSLSTRRICLVDVSLLESSKHSWDLHDSCILVNVAGDGPHVSPRWFHVPLVMVQPILDECASVVNPSHVITEKSSIISFHGSDFCCNWTHPRLSSPFGHGWSRSPSISWIFVLDTVILGGWLTINWGGFGSQVM